MKAKRVYLLPNVITAFALSCGLFIIFRMTMTGLGEASEQLLVQTAGILLLAAFADLLDGAVARAIGAESEFGGFFDSLSDAITFGVGPSVIVLKSLSLHPGTTESFLMATAAMLFSMCGVLRLVRYNVIAMGAKEEGEEVQKEHKKFFTGLPIPASAAAAVSLNLFLVSSELTSWITLSAYTKTAILFSALIFLGYLMISRLKFPSLKSLHVRVASFQVLFFTVVAAVLLFYALLHHFTLFFFLISWGYLMISCIFAVKRRLRGEVEESEHEEELL